jgi:hypothetical protein
LRHTVAGGGVEPRWGRGAAQSAQSKPWTQHIPPYSRTIAGATDFAKSCGIIILDDVRFVVLDALLKPGEDACYGAFASTETYEWEDLLRRGKINVKLRSTVLASDEAILCVFGHEMHEVNDLRARFVREGAISGVDLIALTEAGRRNLHDAAWDVGDALVYRLRRGELP